MEILGEGEMAERLDFMRPLKEEPEKRSMWCIPFEYGSNDKGTRISVSKAKTIAAELRAAVAEEEKAQLLVYFKREEETNKRILHEKSLLETELYAVKAKLAQLERRLRRRKKS